MFTEFSEQCFDNNQWC